MKRKVLGLILVVVAIIGITKDVSAKENVYYITANGIELTRHEYIYLTNFYWPGYPDIMTEDQYDELVEMEFFDSELTVVTQQESGLNLVGPGNSTQSTSHQTSAKHLTIGSACLPTKCIMNLLNTWSVSPGTRSWDVIGAYLSGVSLISHNGTYVSDSNGVTTTYNNLKTATNGVGNSVKLPDSGDDLIINMTFTVTRGGTVFGSYQHAAQNTTLWVSQDYTFSLGGYGNVFDFSETGYNTYDGMCGVDIDV